MGTDLKAAHREPWNKGKIAGQKGPFNVKDIWALRVRLQVESRVRELAPLIQGCLAGVDQASRAEVVGLPLPRPASGLTSSWDPTMHPDPRALGR
jgi:hypothetical protein